jgi:hypothetical protein
VVEAWFQKKKKTLAFIFFQISYETSIARDAMAFFLLDHISPPIFNGWDHGLLMPSKVN